MSIRGLDVLVNEPLIRYTSAYLRDMQERNPNAAC